MSYLELRQCERGTRERKVSCDKGVALGSHHVLKLKRRNIRAITGASAAAILRILEMEIFQR
jgi:hypothetical protein